MSRIVRPAAVTAAAARRVRDPRWHWLANALCDLHEQLGPGDQVTALNLAVTDDQSAGIVYSAAPGDPEIGRYQCIDPDVAADAFDQNYVDLTPPAGLYEGGSDQG